jgi:hypothetical protein
MQYNCSAHKKLFTRTSLTKDLFDRVNIHYSYNETMFNLL